RNPIGPRYEIPRDRAQQRGEYHVRIDDRDVDHPASDCLRHRGADGEQGQKIERRRPYHRRNRAKHARADNCRYRIGGIVKAVTEIEDERDDDYRDDVTNHTLSVLECDRLQDVRNVFRLVEGVLDLVVQLLPFDHFDRIECTVEQRTHRLVIDGVALFLEFLELLCLESNDFRILHSANGCLDLHSRTHHHFRQRDCCLMDCCDPEDLDAARGTVQQIHHLVQSRRELMDVLAVERRDKGPVQPIDYLTSYLVRFVLGGLDRLNVLRPPLRLPEKL